MLGNNGRSVPGDTDPERESGPVDAVGKLRQRATGGRSKVWVRERLAEGQRLPKPCWAGQDRQDAQLAVLLFSLSHPHGWVMCVCGCVFCVPQCCKSR